MRKLFRIGLAVTTMAAALPAQAATFVFNTVNSGRSSGSDIGNSFTYATRANDGSVVNMKVTGWSVATDYSVMPGTVHSWNADGLGIYQQGEKDAGNLHQIDNVNGWEFALLQFDRAVTLTSGVLNPFKLTDLGYSDSDAFISNATLSGAWDQNLTGRTFGSLLPTFRDNGVNTDNTTFKSNLQTFNMPAGAAGNVWIVGGSYFGPDDRNDAFKLAQISGSTPGAVPEPASWMMMIVGFGAIGAAIRRRRSKVATTPDLA
ncbi:PEPxxWA-CTERM sorting domain-containing protein [Sphingomonas rubra]|uniref:PEP-CTERM protein-sorting domain-containing protein n=1 Tax=Sphingomonas rubra TaxID=634430 RepID=A0A1I5QLV6_9SPHN|nr:PEPxxWA-CTERM sorting domain-containing protein [Sphingomonas rubra]SFP47274.1 PEP-CTERM protein-sorting domain-containing protein [Sphingomonas rubra]